MPYTNAHTAAASRRLCATRGHDTKHVELINGRRFCTLCATWLDREIVSIELPEPELPIPVPLRDPALPW